MKEFFKDIFEYHNHFNQKLIEQLMENKSMLPERTIPLFLHTFDAQQLWNERITNQHTIPVSQSHSLQEYKHISNDNSKETIRIVDGHELDEKIIYKNSKGIEFTNSMQQILFPIANHLTHHKGQIISDLRQSGIEPIVTDYIFYKR